MTATAARYVAAIAPKPSAAGHPPVVRRRLTKEARREQLLASARELLIEHGSGALTMEGLAARAGVDKALPYRHFANADAVVDELLAEYNQTMATRVIAAMAAGQGSEAKTGAAVQAFFDVVAEHGSIITVLTRMPPGGSGSTGGRVGQHFIAQLLVAELEVPRRSALAAAAAMLGVLMAGVESCGLGESPRPLAQRLATDACLAILATARAA